MVFMYRRYVQIIFRSTILVSAFLFFTPLLFSQTVYHPENINPFNEPWRWNNFPEIESDGVRCVIKAKNGKFLFGTNHGVLSYDGICWKYIDSTFSDKTVNNLFSDYKQEIYATTDNGLFYHSVKGWNKIFPKKFISKIAKLYKVGVIRELSDGSLLISTGQTFYSGLIHLKKGKITFYSSKKTIESLKKQNLDWKFKTVSEELINDKGFYVEDFFMDTDKTIWGVAAPENKHIKIFWFKYDPDSGTFTTLAVYTQNDGIHNAYRNKISRIGKEIWVINGVHDVGINTFNGKKWNYIEPDKTVCDDFLHTSIIKTKDGTIWIGGLGVIYSISNGKWKSYKNPEFSLPNARIELFEDNKGYLWVLAKQKALFRIDYSSNEWKTYKNLNFQCQTKDGIKYFLSFEGRVVVNNKGKWYSLGPENGLPSQPVKVFLTRNKQLWVVGSHNQTAAIANYNGQKWTMNLYPNLSWGIDYRSAFEDKSGNIWFGAAVDIRTEKGEKAGVLCYQLHNGSYKVVHYPAIHSTAMYNAYGIGQSKDGRIWVGGSHLASFDGHQWKRYYKPVEKFQHQEYISTLRNGKMWIGSRYYGAFSFDGSKWQNYTIENGLHSNAIISILPVNDKNIWVATDKGFCRYDGVNWANSVFSGQMTFTREGGELFLDLNGSLWINKSMREWKRRSLSHKQLDNNVKQNFFSYNYQPDHNLPETNIITKPNTFSYLSSIVMDWSGKDYFNTTPTERLSYSYRLNNGEWSPFMEKSYFTYYGLADGKYTFEVRSRDLDFNIDNTPAKIEFVVSPPIWKQAWFILLIIVFIVIILVYQKRIHNRNFQLSRLNQKLAISKDKLEIQKEQIVEQNKREMEGMNARMRFFTNISHEFRTPLTLITGNISRILQQSNQEFNASTKEDLNTIERNSNRLLKLINQLMDFRKLESGQMPLRQTQGDVVIFLEELYFSFKLFAETQHIELLFEKKAKKIEGWFDEDKLEKIIINLISNAIKFSPEGGKVKLSIELEGTHYKIQVLDTGIGIDPSETEKIFEPFYQAPSGITFSNQGTGIGLSFVKNLVELHGGSIKAILLQSENGISTENYKTCFEVLLPVQSDSLQKEENHNPQSDKSLIPSNTISDNISDNISEISNNETSQSGNEKYKPSVLFVDDNEELCQFVYQSLHDDFIITLASDGKKGLEKALEILPDLIISDVMMLEMNGIDLCKAIKKDELINHIPVILLTSRSTEEHYLDGYKSGADDYLLKPFSITLLKARIWNLIEIRKTLKEQFSKNLLQLPSIKIESKVDSEFLKKVMALIEANMSEPDFNVDVLSSEMGLSSRHLLNKIQSLTEFKPVELIQIMRLKRASELLKEQKLTISEVAYEVGFSSPSYFSKCFQKQYQTSPTDFINSLKS
jgi:signal transduction histidine kinase/DNA-binding response OmpR family regulator/ligand-binding sensor domain-containing protein